MQTNPFYENRSSTTNIEESIKSNIHDPSKNKTSIESPFSYNLFINNDVSTSDSAEEYQRNKIFTDILINCSKEESEETVSPFISATKDYLEKFGIDGVNLLETYIVNLTSFHEDRDFITSLMELLGDINNQSSYEQRYIFLRDNLESKITEVRYGSVLGLASMRDKRAIPKLENALTDENIEIVYNSIKDTLDLLRR